MKKVNETKTTLTAVELFNKLVTTTSKQEVVKETRTINGITYFKSKYSKRWFEEKDRCGKKHNYSRADINVWNSIYSALSPLKKLHDQLIAEGKLEEAEAIFTAEHKILWAAKDSDTSLYANTGGLTDEELSNLEA